MSLYLDHPEDLRPGTPKWALVQTLRYGLPATVDQALRELQRVRADLETRRSFAMAQLSEERLAEDIARYRDQLRTIADLLDSARADAEMAHTLDAVDRTLAESARRT